MTEYITYIKNRKCIAESKNIKIIDSYKIKDMDIEIFVIKLKLELSKMDMLYRRSYMSWIKELYAHNYLYNKGIRKDKTKDCDINEDEKWYRLLLYSLMYCGHRLVRKR